MIKLEGVPIVMLSMSRWDSNISSASICLAREMAKRQKVYYVDMPFTYKDFFLGFKKPEIKKRRISFFSKPKSNHKKVAVNPNLIVIIPGLILPINYLKKGRLYNSLHSYNDQIFSNVIHGVLKSEGISEYILFNSFNPFFGKKLIPKLPPKMIIYQSRDDISTLYYVNKHGPDKEMEWLHLSNINLATSRYLAEKLARLSGKKVDILNNGVELDIFLNLKQKIQKKAPRKRKIIYSGNIDQRIDFELLNKLIIKYSDYQFHFVGPISSNDFYKKGLHNFEHVFLYGSLPKSEMAKILNEADIAIIPFLINEQTKSIYPLKINEYLACGKNVVTTNFSNDLLDFRDIVYIMNSTKEFLEIFNQIPIDSDKVEVESRIQKARQNSWSNRLAQLDSIVNSQFLE